MLMIGAGKNVFLELQEDLAIFSCISGQQAAFSWVEVCGTGCNPGGQQPGLRGIWTGFF
jgi:hypothetical protein